MTNNQYQQYAARRWNNPNTTYTYSGNRNNTEQSEEDKYFNIDWSQYVDLLSSIAMKERWTSPEFPYKKILINYISHTYDKLKTDKEVVITDRYGLFNTGLYTDYYQEIYALYIDNNIYFVTEYELVRRGIEERPHRANYFTEPSLLLFDWHYPININYQHMLDDENNMNRLPDNIKNSPNRIKLLNGAIDEMKKRVSENYRLAIPQYYNGTIQLLLPICLQDNTTPDVALVVTKIGNCYQGHTLLSIEMAYNNARLISKPEANWLSLQSI